jgi:hypothetical protein
VCIEVRGFVGGSDEISHARYSGTAVFASNCGSTQMHRQLSEVHEHMWRQGRRKPLLAIVQRRTPHLRQRDIPARAFVF